MKITICDSVFHSIIASLEYFEVETCGIIGSTYEDGIDAFEKDFKAYSTRYGCRFSNQIQQIVGKWKREGIAFRGIVHSHPPKVNSLSPGDIQYAKEIIKRNELSVIMMGIVSEGKLFMYCVNGVSADIEEVEVTKQGTLYVEGSKYDESQTTGTHLAKK